MQAGPWLAWCRSQQRRILPASMCIGDKARVDNLGGRITEINVRYTVIRLVAQSSFGIGGLELTVEFWIAESENGSLNLKSLIWVGRGAEGIVLRVPLGLLRIRQSCPGTQGAACSPAVQGKSKN